MLLSVLLQRRAFVVFGAFGVFLHLAQFAHRTFAGSLAFPLVLSVIGVLIIYAGVQFQRHQERIEAAIVTSIPDAIRRYLPTGRNPRS